MKFKSVTVILLIQLSLYSFASGCNDTLGSKGIKEYISVVKKDRDSILEFSHFLYNNIQVDFQASHWFKANVFVFYEFKNDKLINEIPVSDSVQNKFLWFAEKYSIKRIHKKTGENFYRFKVYNSNIDNIYLLILRPTEKGFDFSFDSELAKIPILESFDAAKLQSDRLFKITDSIMILYEN